MGFEEDIALAEQQRADAVAALSKAEEILVDQAETLESLKQGGGGGTDPVPPEPGPSDVRRVPILGGATSNNQGEFDDLNEQWGPIRATREYDNGEGIHAINGYPWFNFAKQFDYVFISVDEQKSTASYRDIANGEHDDKWRQFLSSLEEEYPGKRGAILIGNEPNTESVDPAAWRDAAEHCIDTFGDVPVPGFVWGVAFSNFNVWGQASTDGEAWLPRRDQKRFCVETHCYGKDTYVPPEDMLGRTFIPAMHKGERWQNWDWCVGEMSAKEDSTKTKKAEWFTAFGEFVAAEEGCAMLPFDTGVGGSAPINTSEAARQAVKDIAQAWQGNNWQ